MQKALIQKRDNKHVIKNYVNSKQYIPYWLGY